MNSKFTERQLLYYGFKFSLGNDYRIKAYMDIILVSRKQTTHQFILSVISRLYGPIGTTGPVIF